MKDIRSLLQQKLKDLEITINETRARLPAHSVKVPIMTELLELEDEYDLTLKKLKSLNE